MSTSILIIYTGLDFILLGQATKFLRQNGRIESYQPPSTYRSHRRCHNITTRSDLWDVGNMSGSMVQALPPESLNISWSLPLVTSI